MNPKTALIIGATGLTGEECLKQLLDNVYYNRVIALTRKPLLTKHPRLQNVVVDFDEPEKYTAAIKADDVYCAIGTTIGKAGSKEAFRHVDYEIPRGLRKLPGPMARRSLCWYHPWAPMPLRQFFTAGLKANWKKRSKIRASNR